jgi:hypothetical protein
VFFVCLCICTSLRLLSKSSPVVLLPQTLPVPAFNIINGGSHAGNNLAMQEFMILPIGVKTYSEALQAGSEVKSYTTNHTQDRTACRRAVQVPPLHRHIAALCGCIHSTQREKLSAENNVSHCTAAYRIWICEAPSEVERPCINASSFRMY